MSVFSDGFSDLHGRVVQFPKGRCPLVENHWLGGFINLQTSEPQASIFRFTSPHSTCFWQLTPKSRPFWDPSQRHLFRFAVSFHPVWRVGDEAGDRAASSLLETEVSACGWPVIWRYIHLLGSPKGQLQGLTVIIIYQPLPLCVYLSGVEVGAKCV